MMIEIPIPSRCNSLNQRIEFVQEIIDWGTENLENKTYWNYALIALQSPKMGMALATTDIIRFEMMDEEDGMAIVLAFSEG